MKRLFWTLILLLLPSELMAARKIFLSIGINSYQESYWRPLRFADKDAHDIAKALSPSFNGGRVLSGSEQPSGIVRRDDILAELHKLSQENLREDDVIVVYLSGHGTVGRTSEGRIEKYIVASDSKKNDLQGTALSHSELFKKFNALKSRRKVLILDSCYSGGGKSRLSENILEQLALSKGEFFKEPDLDIAEGTVVLAASAWGEEATESVEKQNGLYTHFLIEGFDRDYNGDGAVTITEAHQFATQKVWEISAQRQHPSARTEMVGLDPIIVRGSRSKGHPLLFAYDWMAKKLRVEINGKNMGNLSKGGLLVPEGLQKLVLKDESGKPVVDRHVNFKQGQEYTLAQFIYEDPLWALRLGRWQGKALNPAFRGLLPAGISGYQLGVRKEEAYRDFSLDAQILLLPEGESSVDSDERRVRQKVEGGRVSLLLGQQHNFDRRIRKDWAFYLAGGIGVSYLRLERELDEFSFIEKKQDMNAPGLASNLEIGLESLTAGLQLTLRVGAEVYSNDLEQGRDLPALISSEIALGTIW